jgi:hypothetical protein
MRSWLEAGGRRAWRASEACTKRGPPLGSPFGEQSWRNHDAIMVRLMSHHWHSASDALEAGGRRAWRASKACTMREPPLGSPFGEQSQGNHDAIMIRLMFHHWQSASDALDAGGRRKWRAIKRGPPLGRPPR